MPGRCPALPYLEDCASIVYEKPHKSRHAVDWPPALKEKVGTAMARYDFLDGSSFES